VFDGEEVLDGKSETDAQVQGQGVQQVPDMRKGTGLPDSFPDVPDMFQKPRERRLYTRRYEGELVRAV